MTSARATPFLHPELKSRFWNPLKAHHRETLASYTDRVLPANQEGPYQQARLIRLARRELKGMTESDIWARIISYRAELDLLHFLRAGSTDLHHPDGTDCETCVAGIDERWLCTGCSVGLEIPQYPHLDNIICSKHQRWVGPGTTAAEQQKLGHEWLLAERQFQLLRRRHQLDVHLYLTLRTAFRTARRACITKKETMTHTDIAIFPMMMLVANALMGSAFLLELLDPNKRYSAAFQILDGRVRAAVGDGHEEVTRALWLYFRPTFLSVREHVFGRADYSQSWEHDFAVPGNVIAALPRLTSPAEAFRNYLTPTKDYELTEANWRDVLVHHYPSAETPMSRKKPEKFHSICRNGHRLLLSYDVHHKFRNNRTDSCGVCSGKILEIGTNDLATRYPQAALQYQPEDNDGILASQILPNTSQQFVWRCKAENHAYRSSPGHIISEVATCDVCRNRRFLPGANDLETKRPDLAFEWHPDLNNRLPSGISINSTESAWWRCLLGHIWEATISARVQGHGCHRCAMRKIPPHRTLAAKFPDIAAEWDHDANGSLAPETVAANSNDTVGWRCTQNHPYPQRIDARVAGSGCPYCSHRQAFPGETDILAAHPLIAVDWDWDKNYGVSPDQILPGTKPYFWKCRLGHESQQSVPHRVKSKGCVQCPPGFRSAAKGT